MRRALLVLADPNYVAHTPLGLGPKEAVPLICAGITTYKGIKETERYLGNGSRFRAAAALATRPSNTPRR